MPAEPRPVTTAVALRLHRLPLAATRAVTFAGPKNGPVPFVYLAESEWRDMGEPDAIDVRIEVPRG